MADFVWRDGQRLTPYMLKQINRLDADFFAKWGYHIIVSSAIRTNAEQEAIFRERYVVASQINGRRVYDIRVWNGVTWYRISSAGTVAVPGSSNHEIQGSTAAVDIRDTGNDAGITVASSPRGRWIRENCWKYDMVATGDSFGEGWHFDIKNVFSDGGGTPAGGGETTGWPARDLYGEAWVKEIQKKANRLGAKLDVDGKDGPSTQAWVKSFQSYSGLEADGVAGPQTNGILDQLLNLSVDGELGKLTVRRLQYAFGAKPDGEWGAETTSKIQAHLGVNVDGAIGPVTIKALQRALKVNADGEIGPNTIRALQTWLNSGTYLTPVPEPSTPTTPTEPTEPSKPEATPRTPTYPKALRAWNVPLSSSRDSGDAIEWFIIHHQASVNDDEGYFKSDNSRGSCPTWQVKKDGSIVEFISPDKRPSSTGGANSKSVAVETQNTNGDPIWGISTDSHESIAQVVAWVSQQTEINGVPVRLELDRAHVFGHNETKSKTGIEVPATACPGPSMNLDWIVNRAKEIVAAATPKPDPTPNPEEPEIVVTREEILKRRQAAVELVSFFDKLLKNLGT